MQVGLPVKSISSVAQKYLLRLKSLLSVLNLPKTLNAPKKVQEGLFSALPTTLRDLRAPSVFPLLKGLQER